MLQVIANQVSVYEIVKKNDLGQISEANEYTFKRGQVIPDWLDSDQAFVLVSSGLAAEVGEHPDETVRPYGETGYPRMAHDARVARVDTSANAVQAADINNQGDDDPDNDTQNVDGQQLPADYAAKSVWVDYAVNKLPDGQKMTKPEADLLTKDKLVTEVKQRAAGADADAADGTDADLPQTY